MMQTGVKTKIKLDRVVKLGLYKTIFKRLLDICCSLLAIIILSPVLLIIAILVRIAW